MKIVSTLILTLATVAAMADVPVRPHIEPGPIQEINAQGVDAMDALVMAKSADLKKFIGAGNTIKSATFQALGPGDTNYVFVRQQCMLGGIAGGQCLGGAQLQVRVSEKRAGSNVEKKATSSVNLIK